MMKQADYRDLAGKTVNGYYYLLHDDVIESGDEFLDRFGQWTESFSVGEKPSTIAPRVDSARLEKLVEAARYETEVSARKLLSCLRLLRANVERFEQEES